MLKLELFYMVKIKEISQNLLKKTKTFSFSIIKGKGLLNLLLCQSVFFSYSTK